MMVKFRLFVEPNIIHQKREVEGTASDNPRYPHVFVGKQAIYTDQDVQMIVAVVSDDCDDKCDCFTLNPLQILRDLQKKHSLGNAVDVSQPVGESCWKLQALI
jgi:hypothetical protein